MNAPSAPPLVDRHFTRMRSGRLTHWRTAGSARAGEPPLLLAHAGPGSSAGLVPLIQQLAPAHRVIAPDMPGNGDSEPLPAGRPELVDYVDHLVELLDALGVVQVDFCGQHTGAHIGCELALRHPERVRLLMLDGIALFEPELLADMQARYAPPLVPDDHGGHLAWAWQFVGDLFLHFPYYRRDPAHRLGHSPVPPAATRQALVTDILKAWPTWHLAYGAVYAHPTAERLAMLRHPTLVMAAEGDPLEVYLDAAAALVPGARKARMARAERARVMMAFAAGDAAVGPHD